MFTYAFDDSSRPQPGTSLQLTSQDMGLPEGVPIAMTRTQLQGGKQQGVELVTLTVGTMCLRIVPTRGLGVLDVTVNGVRFGWDSPVKEVVNPAFINQEAGGGLGWLEGFNEMLVRCGYEWSGHPGEDRGQFLSLHGRVQNTPASQVVLTVEQQPPYRVSLSGRVDEKRFKQVDFETQMTLIMTPDKPELTVKDRLTNQGDYEKEYQVIYHNNFGTPVLEEGGRVELAAHEVSPFNEQAKAGLAHWQEVNAPTKGFDEQVFNIKPKADAQGESVAMLFNQSKDKGVAVSYSLKQLPVFTFWKNTDTLKQGYVIGLEPGTSYAYNRRYQRDLGLVPTIGAGESKDFDLTFSFLTSEAEVATQRARIAAIQGDEVIAHRSEPLVVL